MPSARGRSRLAASAFAVALALALAGCTGPQADPSDASPPTNGSSTTPAPSTALTPAPPTPVTPSPTPLDTHGGLPPQCWVTGFHVAGAFDTGVAQQTIDVRDVPRARFNESLSSANFTVWDDGQEVFGRRERTFARAGPGPGTNWTLRVDVSIPMDGPGTSCSQGFGEDAWPRVQPEMQALYAHVADVSGYAWNGTLARQPQVVTT